MSYNNPYLQSGVYPRSDYYRQEQPLYGQQQQSYPYESNYYQPRPFGIQRNTQPYDDVMRDFNARSNDNLQNNLTKGAAISELETILDGERRRAKELRGQMESDLENEKRLRVDFENKMIRLRDESQKREIFVSELEYKLQNAQKENEALIHENRAMKDELNRLQEMYGLKIRELEDRISYTKKQQIQMDDRFRSDFDRMKSDYEQKIEAMSREWDFRIRASEEKTKNLMIQKQDLEQENQILQDTIMKVRLEAEEDLREAIVRVQDEEVRKFMSQMRSVEQKLKASEEARELQVRKNQDLVRVLTERDRSINEMQMEFDSEKMRFKQELSEYHNQLNQAQISRDKLRNELQGRDAVYQRSEAELIEQSKILKREKEQRKQEIDHIIDEANKEKRVLEDIRDQQARKINDQDRVIKQMEQDIDRIKIDYDRLCSSIQNNINRGINQAISDNQGGRFDNRRPQFGQKYE